MEHPLQSTTERQHEVTEEFTTEARPITKHDVKFVFLVGFGFEPREADIQVLDMLGLTSQTLAEYIWDHWLGEPEEPALNQVHETIIASLNEFHREGTEPEWEPPTYDE